MRARRQIVDLGFDEIVQELTSIGSMRVQVGVQGDQANRQKDPKNPANMAEIALYNEYGTEWPDGTVHIPERPAHRNAFDKNEADLNQNIRGAVIRVQERKIGARNALELIGAWYQGKVKGEITDIKDPPNAKLTLKRKFPKANPLIHTGEMRNAVTVRILRNNEQ
jgi:hypothetical protein